MPAEPRQAVFYAHSINLSFIKLAWKWTFTETGLLSKEKERKKKIVKQAWKWTFEAITLWPSMGWTIFWRHLLALNIFEMTFWNYQDSQIKFDHMYLAFLVHIWLRVLHSNFKLQCSFQYLSTIWMKWKLVNGVFDHVDFRKDLTPLYCVPYSSTTNPLWMMFILGKAFGQHHQFGQ